MGTITLPLEDGGENEKHVFLRLPRRARARLYVQTAEEFIVPNVFVANAAEIGDGRR